MPSLVEYGLVGWLSDWVSEGHLMYIVVNELRIEDRDTRDALVLGTMTWLLTEGYVIPTTYGDQWSVGAGEAVERIAAAWLGRENELVDIVQLELTEKGWDRAEAIAVREGWKVPPRPTW